MHKEVITYTDYDGNERTETFYFNLNKAEITEMELSVTGGLSESLKSIVEKKDVPNTIATIKDIILRSYGIKSPDGKRFQKSKEISEEFEQSEAYSELFMKMLGNAEYAAAFMNSIIPADLAKAAQEYVEKNPDALAGNIVKIPTE
jgi:hypothetical protein